jgi:hypothetical protein
MQNAVFWDVTPCDSKNRSFRGKYRLHHQGGKNKRVFPCSVFQLLVTASVVPSSLIHVTMMMEAIRSSRTSVLTTATRRPNPEDGILQTDLISWIISGRIMKLIPPKARFLTRKQWNLKGSEDVSLFQGTQVCLPSPDLRTETDPLSETFVY